MGNQAYVGMWGDAAEQGFKPDYRAGGSAYFTLSAVTGDAA